VGRLVARLVKANGRFWDAEGVPDVSDSHISEMNPSRVHRIDIESMDVGGAENCLLARRVLQTRSYVLRSSLFNDDFDGIELHRKCELPFEGKGLFRLK
jgi:hypothetical protein